MGGYSRQEVDINNDKSLLSFQRLLRQINIQNVLTEYYFMGMLQLCSRRNVTSNYSFITDEHRNLNIYNRYFTARYRPLNLITTHHLLRTSSKCVGRTNGQYFVCNVRAKEWSCENVTSLMMRDTRFQIFLSGGDKMFLHLQRNK